MQLLFIFLVLIGCLSCNVSPTKDIQGKATIPDTFLGTEFDIDTADELTCARGIARPTLKKTAFPDATFQYGQDSFSATERVKLKNGDSLIVRHGGCEYYILTFRFVYAAPVLDSINAAFAYKKVTESMRNIYHELDESTDIEFGIKKLSEYLKKHPRNPHFGEEVDFGGEDVRSYVTVDKAESLHGNKSAVEISFSVGPL